MGGDLHVHKSSHIALPIDSKMEWHFTPEDLGGKKLVPNKTYNVLTPVICTSADEGGGRVRQVAKSEIDPSRIFTSIDPDEDAKPPKAERTRHGSEIMRHNKSR